jgi:hypothetical protein
MLRNNEILTRNTKQIYTSHQKRELYVILFLRPLGILILCYICLLEENSVLSQNCQGECTDVPATQLPDPSDSLQKSPRVIIEKGFNSYVMQIPTQAVISRRGWSNTLISFYHASFIPLI